MHSIRTHVCLLAACWLCMLSAVQAASTSDMEGISLANTVSAIRLTSPVTLQCQYLQKDSFS